MPRAIDTATEAKTAAFEDLRVIVVSGTYPGGHSLIGSMMGKAVYEAVMEALEKQNGFKPADK